MHVLTVTAVRRACFKSLRAGVYVLTITAGRRARFNSRCDVDLYPNDTRFFFHYFSVLVKWPDDSAISEPKLVASVTYADSLSVSELGNSVKLNASQTPV